MAYGSQAGYARTNPRAPQAFGVCDFCGFWWQRVDLLVEREWYGDNLADTGFRVCKRCLDKPQAQLKPVILPQDPIPINEPRPERYESHQGPNGPRPIVWQNLNGFNQFVGPQGTIIQNPVVAELDPTMPLGSKAAVLASAESGWGLPIPTTLNDWGGAIAIPGIGQQIMPANPNRTYLLLFNPAALSLSVAQNMMPTVGISAASLIASLRTGNPSGSNVEALTVQVGTGSAMLQNGLLTPPVAPVWTGAVFGLGLVAGAPFFAWDG